MWRLNRALGYGGVVAWILGTCGKVFAEAGNSKIYGTVAAATKIMLNVSIGFNSTNHGGLPMRAVRQLQSLVALVTPLIGAVFLLLQPGCMNENKSQFYAYCDDTGCYQCSEIGCTAVTGQPPGTTCKTSAQCAPGCFCTTDLKCSEGGFCDRAADCSSGYTCNVARHSCEPSTTTTTPKSCRVQTDCGAGNECRNTSCQPVPVPANHCVFNRECGTGGQCVNGLCQKACVDDDACGTGRACVGSRCVPKAPGMTACVSNAQCGAGQTCIDSVCHLGCSKDAECQANNANDQCVSGLCRPSEGRVPECKANADCTAGRECVNAQCRSNCFASSDCAACTDGAVCNTGYCLTAREVAPLCVLASGCQSASPNCIDGACAK